MLKLRSSFASAASRTRLIIAAMVIMTFTLLTLYFGGQAKPISGDPWGLNYERRVWNFEIISDDDHKSKIEDKMQWKSVIKKGKLIRDDVTSKYSVSWESTKDLKTSLNEKGRAMELSLLVYFNDRYYSCDDRTGIVYEILRGEQDFRAIARFILVDGDGTGDKPFKCEWASVKGEYLYIGSFGKEFTTERGEIVNHNPMWIKKISKNGIVTSENWRPVYNKLREETGTSDPGYLFHEAVVWNQYLKKWFFLPRRVSTERYDPKLDESRGGNLIISCSENFDKMNSLRIEGNLLSTPTHGFSAFKFIPGRPKEILALRSEEIDNETATFVMVLDVDGKILMDETLIERGHKYEGLEFNF